MKVVGYASRWSVAPGGHMRVMVSTSRPHFEADLVQLLHGDESPEGPGFKQVPLRASFSGVYPGRVQPLRSGSYVHVPHDPRMDFSQGLTLVAWVFPTKPGDTRQTIMSKGLTGDGASGFWLGLDEDGLLGATVGDSLRRWRLKCEAPLRKDTWYAVGLAISPETKELLLWRRSRDRLPAKRDDEVTQRRFDDVVIENNAAPLLLAASTTQLTRGEPIIDECFNGKIADPELYGEGLSRQAWSVVIEGGELKSVGKKPIAAWDFSRNPMSSVIHDRTGNSIHGTAVNMPTRCVTGPTWDGTELDYRLAPDAYGAIHFHADDLEDAKWEPDFGWDVPTELKSGVYAFRLKAEGDYYIPFFVTPRPEGPRAKILFIAPTLTYLAYGNEHYYSAPYVDWTKHTYRPLRLGPEDAYVAQHPELGPSLYDTHTDLSGVCYASRRRPIPNLGPKYRAYWNDSARHLGADLYLIDWLAQEGYEHDVITDEDLHHQGVELLEKYRVVISGSHPEYATWPMIQGLEQYVHGGGRLMYLGGNGLVWVTSLNPERPHVMEVRKVDPTLTIPELGAGPGQHHHSDTGEAGGWWRQRDRHPERILGVGHTASNWNAAVGYHRQPDSLDPRVSFIFEGVGLDEIIGDFGLCLGGAAGDEVDRMDFGLQSPLNTLRLATARLAGGHSPSIEGDPDDVEERRLSADMTFYETGNGGAVFSVGSICWTGSLSDTGYKNNVARITKNVLKAFLEREHF